MILGARLRLFRLSRELGKSGWGNKKTSRLSPMENLFGSEREKPYGMKILSKKLQAADTKNEMKREKNRGEA